MPVNTCVGNVIVGVQELESERVKLMEEVTANKKKMKELEDNLLYRLTSTKVRFPHSHFYPLDMFFYFHFVLLVENNRLHGWFFPFL